MGQLEDEGAKCKYSDVKWSVTHVVFTSQIPKQIFPRVIKIMVAHQLNQKLRSSEQQLVTRQLQILISQMLSIFLRQTMLVS